MLLQLFQQNGRALVRSRSSLVYISVSQPLLYSETVAPTPHAHLVSTARDGAVASLSLFLLSLRSTSPLSRHRRRDEPRSSYKTSFVRDVDGLRGFSPEPLSRSVRAAALWPPVLFRRCGIGAPPADVSTAAALAGTPPPLPDA